MPSRPTLAFAALCLLAGSAWLLDELLPTPASPTSYLVAAAILLGGPSALARRFRRAPRLPGPQRVRIALWATALFLLPAVLVELTPGTLSGTARSLIFTLVPALLVFLLTQLGTLDDLRLLVPALAGLAGAALILPFSLPSSLRGSFSLAATVLVAATVAIAALRLHTLLAGVDLAQSLALCCGGPGLLGIPWFFLRQRPTAPPRSSPLALNSYAAHLLLTTVLLCLSVYLLPRFAPIRFSTRFLLVPLVTIFEGYLILRPENTWTLAAGVLLLAAGALMLLREGASAQSPAFALSTHTDER